MQDSLMQNPLMQFHKPTADFFVPDGMAPDAAIAVMMKDLKYVSRDVSADVEKNMDYSFLADVTKKPKSQLGY